MVCTILGFTWQFLTVRYNYAGNWTSLFCTGSAFPPPAPLARENIFVFANSTGYDGQFYHYVAHDPLYQTDVGRSIPDASVRYRRILLPGLAYLLAWGRQDCIDASYYTCNLGFLLLGSWWLGLCLSRLGIHAGFAVLYVLAPATVVSLDRLTVDLAFTSLTLGFAAYLNSSRWKLYALLVTAALCRDTGFVLTAACCLPLLVARRYRECLLFASAIVPAGIWNLFVTLQVPLTPAGMPGQLIPFRGLVEILLRPASYPLSGAVAAAVHVLDYIELLGLVLAFVLAFRFLRKTAYSPIQAACLLWAITGLMLPRIFWEDCYSGARVFSPLVMLQLLESYAVGPATATLPVLLVSPRIWLQVSPQVLGIARALFR